MKSFFRLLFISFGLLLLLGISNKQSNDIIENPVESIVMASQDFHPGIIPGTSSEEGLSFLSCKWSLLPGKYCTTPLQKEFFTEKCILTRLLFLELQYGEYSLEILTKQGVQYHLQAPEDELFLS